MFYGCFESGDSQVQLHWDGDQVLYADFKNQKMVWTVPLLEEQSEMFPGMYKLALVSRERICHVYLAAALDRDRSPTVTQGKHCDRGHVISDVTFMSFNAVSVS